LCLYVIQISDSFVLQQIHFYLYVLTCTVNISWQYFVLVIKAGRCFTRARTIVLLFWYFQDSSTIRHIYHKYFPVAMWSDLSLPSYHHSQILNARWSLFTNKFRNPSSCCITFTSEICVKDIIVFDDIM